MRIGPRRSLWGRNRTSVSSDPFAALPRARRSVDSPFDPDGPPAGGVLHGRDDEQGRLAAALLPLLEGSGGGWLAVEGSEGIGTTTLLGVAGDALVERGGAVHSVDGTRVSTVVAAQQPGEWEAGDRSRELIDRLSTVDVPVMIVVDDLHAMRDLDVELVRTARERAGEVLLVTGGRPGAAERVARALGDPGPSDLLEPSRLSPQDARRLLVDPLERALGGRADPALVDHAIATADGIPRRLVEWGDAVVRTGTGVAVEAVARRVQQRRDARAAALWATLTDRQQRWLTAVAAAGPDAAVATVAELAGGGDQKFWSMTRDQLLKAGIVHVPARGIVVLSSRPLSDWLTHARPLLASGAPPMKAPEARRGGSSQVALPLRRAPGR